MKKLVLILFCLHLIFSSCNPIFSSSNSNQIYKCGVCKMKFQEEVWAKKCEALGAGEIVITSVDNEGTGNGFDCSDIVSSTNQRVDVFVNGQLMKSGNNAVASDYAITTNSTCSIKFYFQLENQDVVTFSEWYRA